VTVLFRDLIWPGLLAPAGAAALVVALGWALSRWAGRNSGSSHRGGVSGLAVSAALLACFVVASGWPRWLPVDATQRLFFLVGAAGLASLVVGALRSAQAHRLARALIYAALLPLLLRGPIQHAWTGYRALLWLAVLWLAALLAGWAVARSLAPAEDSAESAGALAEHGGPVRRRKIAGAGAIRLAVLIAGAVCLGLSGSARLGLLLLALACGVAVIDALALAEGRSRWRRADELVLSTSFLGLLLLGHFYSELAVWPALLLWAALALLAPYPSVSPLRRLLPLLPAAVATGLVLGAFLDRAEDLSPYGDYQVAHSDDSGCEALELADGWCDRLSCGKLTDPGDPPGGADSARICAARTCSFLVGKATARSVRHKTPRSLHAVRAVPYSVERFSL
jgi:hypothetical protein